MWHITYVSGIRYHRKIYEKYKGMNMTPMYPMTPMTYVYSGGKMEIEIILTSI